MPKLARDDAPKLLPIPSALSLAQYADEHRPKASVLLAVDQEFGEVAALWVAPELADPVGPVEVGEHQDVEQLADPGFRRRVCVLEFALWSRPVMSGDEVALLLEN